MSLVWLIILLEIDFKKFYLHLKVELSINELLVIV